MGNPELINNFCQAFWTYYYGDHLSRWGASSHMPVKI